MIIKKFIFYCCYFCCIQNFVFLEGENTLKLKKLPSQLNYTQKLFVEINELKTFSRKIITLKMISMKISQKIVLNRQRA